MCNTDIKYIIIIVITKDISTSVIMIMYKSGEAYFQRLPSKQKLFAIYSFYYIKREYRLRITHAKNYLPLNHIHTRIVS